MELAAFVFNWIMWAALATVDLFRTLGVWNCGKYIEERKIGLLVENLIWLSHKQSGESSDALRISSSRVA